MLKLWVEPKVEGGKHDGGRLDRPKDYPKNARKWSAHGVEKVAASIREYGWRQPVVVDANDVIVIGHLRRAAGRFLGLTEVPVHVARDLTPAQIRGLRLADNRTNQEASWDEELLAGGQLGVRDYVLQTERPRLVTAFPSQQNGAIMF